MIHTLAAMLVLASSPAAYSTGNTVGESFSHTKRALTSLYADHRTTLYSGCAFHADKSVDYADCAYRIRHGSERAYRIEWEHVVPAAAFGQAFVEWREGDPRCVDRRGQRFRGRHCAAKVNVQYRHVETDMYNLYPEIGELNELRADLPMADVAGETSYVAALQVKAGDGKFEPSPHVKGDVARTYLYMDEAYPDLGILDADSYAQFEAWSAADPVDAWECERSRRIAAVQGNVNAVVGQACDALGL